MNANDEAPSNMEQASVEKAEKNETEIAENDIEPAGNATNDTNDTADAKAEGRLLFSSSLFACLHFFRVLRAENVVLPIDLPPTLHERFMRIKEMVKDAIAAHHTFMIYGRARVVRECMLKRGWCEKFFRKNSTGILLYLDRHSPTGFSEYRSFQPSITL